MSATAAPNLVLQKKWEAVMLYVYSSVFSNMKKLDRITLGTELMASMWRVERTIIQVAHTRYNRDNNLRQIDIEAKTILRMVDLGVRMGSVPNKRYVFLAQTLSEIGKIVGGLLKTGGPPARNGTHP